MIHRIVGMLTLGALAACFILKIEPINNTFRNLLFLLCLIGFCIGLMLFVWRYKPIRFTLIALFALTAAVLILPSRPINTAELKNDYVKRVIAFESTQYIWGGESSRGIDCSGLPRRALQDSLVSYGIRKINGKALRTAMQHWWFDANANALSQGYLNYTTPLNTKGPIKDISYSKLIPGDLAVSSGGAHILVYLGEDKWSQADPGIGYVKTLNGRTDKNPWFTISSSTHRWKIFSD